MTRPAEGESTHWFKYTLKGVVCDPVLLLTAYPFPLCSSLVLLSARAEKVFAVLVKTASHGTISVLDAIILVKVEDDDASAVSSKCKNRKVNARIRSSIARTVQTPPAFRPSLYAGSSRGDEPHLPKTVRQRRLVKIGHTHGTSG
ncbi:hypothetical protein ARMGADRAFT_174890 [Armillaria gallica]|uniref:Uncharacterized protein n=1 Tax=Armillaria gallica TaxID=47427 RepID=A0A2H3C850_ARMGA|nr:hypothetical protein ARMGADRAFT_174890 [Armillaria gallica]